MKIKIAIFSAVAVCIAAISGCSAVGLLNAITPSGNFNVQKDIKFDDGERQSLDIYTPENGGIARPVIVYIYGGGWNSGKKSDYKFIGDAFASKGYITAVADYRIYPSARYPDFLQDNAKAVALIARKYPEKPLILIGHSAGAYNVAKLLTDMDFLRRAGLDAPCSRIAGAIGLAGPYGAEPLIEEPYITIFPDRHAKLDSPIKNMGMPVPPMYFAIGSKDDVVSPLQGEMLASQINKAGGRAKNKIYDGLSHTDVVKVLSRYFDSDSPLLDDLVKFIDDSAKPAKNYCR